MFRRQRKDGHRAGTRASIQRSARAAVRWRAGHAPVPGTPRNPVRRGGARARAVRTSSAFPNRTSGAAAPAPRPCPARRPPGSLLSRRRGARGPAHPGTCRARQQPAPFHGSRWWWRGHRPVAAPRTRRLPGCRRADRSRPLRCPWPPRHPPRCRRASGSPCPLPTPAGWRRPPCRARLPPARVAPASQPAATAPAAVRQGSLPISGPAICSVQGLASASFNLGIAGIHSMAADTRVDATFPPGR